MTSIALDEALNSVMKLSEEQQAMLLEIMQQRQIEAWRKQVAQQAQSSIQAFHKGTLQSQSFEKNLDILRNRDKFDYTVWRENLWKNETLESLSQKAQLFYENNL